MWFKTIFRNKSVTQRQSAGLLDQAREFFRPRRSDPAPLMLTSESFLRRLERLNLNAQRTLRGTPISGEHPSRQRLPAAIYSDHRPYSAGDDYRHVDWNAYARHEQVVVRLGETEQKIAVHVLLDASRSMNWGAPTKLASAKQLAAALSYLALAHGDRLHLAPFSRTVLPPFGPASGKGRAIEMLRYLSALQPAEGTSLAHLLTRYVRQYEQGGLLVLCSDLLTTPADGLAAALRVVTPPRWQVLVLHLIDPRELQSDLQGPLELEDSETGERLSLTLDSDTLAIYRRNVTNWQEQLAQTCAKNGATYAPIHTDWPLERAVIPYLRARQVLE